MAFGQSFAQFFVALRTGVGEYLRISGEQLVDDGAQQVAGIKIRRGLPGVEEDHVLRVAQMKGVHHAAAQVLGAMTESVFHGQAS